MIFLCSTLNRMCIRIGHEDSLFYVHTSSAVDSPYSATLVNRYSMLRFNVSLFRPRAPLSCLALALFLSLLSLLPSANPLASPPQKPRRRFMHLHVCVVLLSCCPSNSWHSLQLPAFRVYRTKTLSKMYSTICYLCSATTAAIIPSFVLIKNDGFLVAVCVTCHAGRNGNPITVRRTVFRCISFESARQPKWVYSIRQSDTFAEHKFRNSPSYIVSLFMCSSFATIACIMTATECFIIYMGP